MTQIRYPKVGRTFELEREAEAVGDVRTGGGEKQALIEGDFGAQREAELSFDPVVDSEVFLINRVSGAGSAVGRFSHLNVS